ncbi:hypothetical protein GCM10010430_47120 [Kitasatospora cystarginea]|uniref:Secreted protein n=1 Tax=Kitasatospora cystarginea TaxID=58350 RepID=A0ABP5RFR8_9ACTN
MDAIGVVLGLVLLFTVAALAMLAVGAVKATKRVAAKVSEHEANARRAVENAALKAKTFTKPGPVGRISAVRLSLRTSLESTRQVLEAGLSEDGQLTEALQLLARLDSHAAELDGELRILEREPDQSRVTAKLAELTERAERITHSAESMRWAAQDRMRRFADDELARLTEACEAEAGSLRHWEPTAASAAAADAAGNGAGAFTASTQGQGAGRSSGQASSGAERKGLGAGRQPGAEDVLGLAAEPLARLAERLRKPSTGSSSAG